ncbi:MAG TPA: glycoside hydrolase family 75 protein [Trichocoleus sp.]|jgi:hypothetical protein
MQSFQVISGGLNLRSAPSDTIIAVLSRGHVVIKIEEATDSKWWKVRTFFGGETLEGYVAARFLSSTSTFPIETLLEIGGISIKRASGESAFLYQAGMSINADGAPNAYHPADTGIDFLANAGYPGNWWALAVDRDGDPFIQSNSDPFPGYYVSTTALLDASFNKQDPRRYVDSLKIPYIVLPGNGDFRRATGVQLGDFAVAFNNSNQQLAFAIYADVGPKNQIGEGSIALSQALGNDPFLRGRVRRGIARGITYIVFPDSGNGKPRKVSEIETETKQLFEMWGGIDRIKSM